MKNAIIRKIALSVAFFQLFSTSLLSSNNNKDVVPKSSYGEYVLVNNNNIPVYKKVDSETGEKTTISIFDEENIRSKQYGANQRVFKSDFNDLIKDQVIWDEMQKYYPIENFECEEDAMFFYQKYFEVIYHAGCGYAAAANYVFRLFEGREEEFYNKFGYPIYTYRNGKIDFNYEVFMLKFFNYFNLDMKKNYEAIDKWILKDFYQHQMFRIAADTDYKRKYKNKIIELTDEEYDEFKRLEKEHERKLDEVSDKYYSTEKERVNLGINLDANFGYLYVYLAKYGIRVDSLYLDNDNDIVEDDILAFDNFTLYKVNQEGEISGEQKLNDWHYVYVVDNDGEKIIVSSWGEKYYLDYSTSQYIGQILLKAK